MPGTGGRSDWTATTGDERQGFVNRVFARVADRYDLMNDLMSARLHRLWKDDMLAWLNPPKRGPYALLDVAGGTGDIAARFLEATGPEARAIVCDISADMLRVGRMRAAREGHDRLRFVQGNAETLPVAGQAMDAYTVGFGIRNVPDIPRALAEAYRVLRPGGRFLCLEFSHVEVPILDALYERYSELAIPALGAVVAGDAAPYRYLIESIQRFPTQERFGAMIREAGFERVAWRSLSGGIAALHSGWRL